MTNFSLETIQQDFKIHDKYQLEIKLDYSLIENKNTHYQVYTYFFVPFSLGISPNRFSPDEISSYILNYIRLKTPPFNLDEFLGNELSPILVVKDLLQVPDWRKDPEINKQIIEQLKLLGAMIKTALRDHLDLIHDRLVNAPSDDAAMLYLKSLISHYIKGVTKVGKAYRKFIKYFNAAYTAPEVFEAYKLTDESLSIQFEDGAVDIYRMLAEYFQDQAQTDLVQSFREDLSALAQDEIAHRLSLGYKSILKENENNEEFVHRVSILKKYSADVLHLQIAEQKEGVLLEQLGFAVAAGLAMFFATVVAFYFQSNYGSLTFPVFIALVIGYMFKDRIKELMREWIAGALLGRFFDHRIDIRKEGLKQKLGRIKNKTFFLQPDRMPKKVVRKREETTEVGLTSGVAGESVFCHAREINLRANAFKNIFSSGLKVGGINDILRIDVRFLLNRMDEPTERCYQLDRDGVRSLDAHKVYYAFVVSKYKSLLPYKETLYTLHRVALNRGGIIRVENLG